MNRLIETKYGGKICFDTYQAQMIKNIYKILPLKDEGKNWDKYLEGLLVELNGLNQLCEDLNYVSLISKLEGLFSIDPNNQKLFRKIIFDCIDALKKIEPRD